jgi:polyhydroxybutyrate depolymerase
MKKCIFFILANLIIVQIFAQLETRDIAWDDTTRQYLEYVPTGYTGDNPVAVVFGLHGLGDNMNNFYNVGINYSADTAGFILIVPEALEFTAYMQTFTAWNTGATMYGITPNADVDDTGFLMAVLDSLIANYNIDTEQIYFFGFSMGGFMCNRLAAEVGDRITAIASVSGTFGVNFTPNPQHHTACLHFHGTNDQTVPYSDNTTGMDADELVEFWRNYNENDTTPVVYQYPDTHQDNLTFERYVYPNGIEQVAHIKVIGGEHLWYSASSNDIDYLREILHFFWHRFPEESSHVNSNQELDLQVFPNPVTDWLNLSIPQNHANLIMYNSIGIEIFRQQFDFKTRIDMSSLPSGMYVLSVTTDNKTKTMTITKE